MASADDSNGEFYQMFKEELTPMLKLLKKKSKRKHFQTHFMRLESPKPKIIQENCRPIYLTNMDAKNLKKINKLSSTAYYKGHTTWHGGIYPWDARMVQHMQIKQCDTSH